MRPLLACLVEEREEAERLLWLPVDEDRAERIRAHLKKALVERAALFANDARHKPFWFHDTRATHLTWRAKRGDAPQLIQAVARHTKFDMTLQYINRASLLRDIGEVFAPLPAELLEAALGFRWVSSNSKFLNRKQGKMPAFVVTPTGIEPVLPT